MAACTCSRSAVSASCTFAVLLKVIMLMRRFGLSEQKTKGEMEWEGVKERGGRRKGEGEGSEKWSEVNVTVRKLTWQIKTGGYMGRRGVRVRRVKNCT